MTLNANNRQTEPDKAATGGKQVWRHHRIIEHLGDIYESDISANAVAIGPYSDINSVRLWHRRQDILVPAGSTGGGGNSTPERSSLVSEIGISVDKPWVGRLEATVEPYGESNNIPGRILFAPGDNIPGFWYADTNDQQWYPPEFDTNNSTGDMIYTIQPELDLLFYLGPIPPLFPRRQNKSWKISGWSRDDVLDSKYWICAPIYGRQTASLTITNLPFAAQPAIECQVFLVNLGPVANSSGQSQNELSYENLRKEHHVLIDAFMVTTDTTGVIRHSMTREYPVSHDYFVVNYRPASGSLADRNSVLVSITAKDS